MNFTRHRWLSTMTIFPKDHTFPLPIANVLQFAHLSLLTINGNTKKNMWQTTPVALCDNFLFIP